MNINFNQHVGIFEKGLPDNLCDKIIDYFNDPNTPKKSRNAEGKNKGIVDDYFTTLYATSPEDQTAKYLRIQLNKYLFQAWEQYSEKYMLELYDKDLYILDCKIQRTLPTQGFHLWHCEQTTETPYRFAVYTIYLNDVEQGGETEFLMQSLRTPAKKGTITLFPAFYTHLHRGNPPLSGEKYIITGWFCYSYSTNKEEIGHNPVNHALFEKTQLYSYYLENK